MKHSNLHKITCDIEEIKDVHNASLPANLKLFASEVKRLYPRGSFGYINREYDSTNREDAVYFYHKDSPYNSGVIGYGNFRYNNSGEDAYVIFSRKIQNRKYHHGAEQNMFMSKDIKVVRRHAAKYLREWEISEVAELNQYNLRNHWDKSMNTLTTVIREKYSNLIGDNHVLMSELRALRDQNHTYVNAEFSSKVDELLEVVGERWEKQRERSPNIIAVVIQPRTSGNMYHAVNYNNITERNKAWIGRGVPYDDNTLPEHIRGKLAVLSMCEYDQWVDNVGYKVSDKVFFVVNADVS